MKKYLWIFIFSILIIVGFIFLFNKNNHQTQEQGYTTQRTATNTNIQNNIGNESSVGENQNATNDINENREAEEEKNKEDEEEKEISEFSTKLPNDTKERYSNIKLACKTLNDTEIKKGETFSLWEVLGCPTKEKGYQKAKAFTSDGEVKQSYGGGICQISTTIYNAVLEVDELDVKERHEHSRDVVYIKDGKDAAVSYKSADFKFKNTLDYDIKIEAKVEDNQVKIKLVRIPE